MVLTPGLKLYVKEVRAHASWPVYAAASERGESALYELMARQQSDDPGLFGEVIAYVEHISEAGPQDPNKKSQKSHKIDGPIFGIFLRHGRSKMNILWFYGEPIGAPPKSIILADALLSTSRRIPKQNVERAKNHHSTLRAQLADVPFSKLLVP